MVLVFCQKIQVSYGSSIEVEVYDTSSMFHFIINTSDMQPVGWGMGERRMEDLIELRILNPFEVENDSSVLG